MLDNIEKLALSEFIMLMISAREGTRDSAVQSDNNSPVYFSL